MSTPYWCYESRFREAFHAEMGYLKKVKWDRGIATYWNKKRRLLSALFLTNRNFATFKCSLEHSNGRCPGMCYFTSLYWYGCIASCNMPNIGIGRIVYMSAWASALYLPCTLKDYISYLLPTWLSAGTGKFKRKYHFIGWQERTNKMKNKSCATNFATQQPFSLLLLLQEPFLLAERKKMCYLSMAANQSQYTNINSFILGYIY